MKEIVERGTVVGPAIEGPPVKVRPKCSICGTEVDINAEDYHVCVPDGEGGFDRKLRSEAHSEWKSKDDLYQVEQAEQAAKLEGVAEPPEK